MRLQHLFGLNIKDGGDGFGDDLSDGDNFHQFGRTPIANNDFLSFDSSVRLSVGLLSNRSSQLNGRNFCNFGNRPCLGKAEKVEDLKVTDF